MLGIRSEDKPVSPDQLVIKNDWLPEMIVQYVCDNEFVYRDNISKRTRKREVVAARQIAMFFLRKYAGLTLKSIAEMFGGRDHTTVIHSIRAVKNLSWSDPKVKSKIQFYDQIFSHEPRQSKEDIGIS